MKPRLTAEQLRVKLQANVVVDPESGCWNWQKSKGSHGYGQISTGKGKQELAHRVSLKVFKGDEAVGLLVLHSCDNRRCCNPEHLSSGSHRDNTQDMMYKGRGPVGSRQGRSVLTEELVLEIYRDERAQSIVAQEFGVSQSNVSMIKGGKTWRHVTSMLSDT